MELINWKEKLEQLYRFSEKWKYVLIVLLAGLLLLSFGNKPKETERRILEETDTAFSLKAFEEEMKTCLTKIEGIGAVELMLTLDSSGREIYASDIRKTSSSGYESTISTVSDGNYGEAPVRVTTMGPEFRGAVVVCEGAGNDRVCLAVTEAVGSLCGLGADRIAVIQMER